MLNKKATFDDFIPLIITLVIVIIAFISCSPLYKAAQDQLQKDVYYEITNIKTDQLLLNYLNKEVEIVVDGDKKKMTFSDLIVLSYVREDFDEWERLTEEFLEKYNDNLPAGWNIRLYLISTKDEFRSFLPPYGEKVASAITYEMIIGGTKHGESFAVIPLLNTDNLIKIRLYNIGQV